MRYIKDLLIEKVVLHVLDNSADEPIFTHRPLTIDEDVEAFVRRHVIKTLNNDETTSCRFLSDNVPVAKEVINVINNPDCFFNSTFELTNIMFKTIKHTEIPSGDMLYVQFIADEQRCYGILKLDYQTSFTHNITFLNEDPVIHLITQEIGLPGTGQELKKCVFFTKAAEEQIEMLVLDKKQKLDESDIDYFVDKYLQAVKISDDTSSTRLLKPSIERWTQKHMSDNIIQANQVRSVIEEALLTESDISLNDVSTVIFGTEEEKEARMFFLEDMKATGLNPDKNIQLDKSYIEKKMKKKTIKTDTGIQVTAEYDFFKDSQRYTEVKNGDGTIDMIIKGVRNTTVK